jgi:hypothetical protein
MITENYDSLMTEGNLVAFRRELLQTLSKPYQPTSFLSHCFSCHASEGWHPAKKKNWMPHHSVFQPLAMLVGKTGVWHDKTCRMIKFQNKGFPCQ